MLRQGAGGSRGGAGTGHGTAATGYRSRRAHTKTRTGCRTCRQRKVKCDETHPICTNCSKRGLHSECEYRDTVVWVHQTNPYPTAAFTPTPTSTSTPGTPSSSSSHQIAPRSDASACGGTPELSPGDVDMSKIDPNILPPRVPPQTLTPTLTLSSTSSPTITTSPLTHPHGYTSFRHIPTPTSFLSPNSTQLTTLRLLHLFTTTTAFSLSTCPAVHNVWQKHIPTLALRLAKYPDQEYLLHAVLALAGLHAAGIRFGEKGEGRETIGKKRKRKAEREQWLFVAREEHQLCLQGFKTAVARYASRGVGEWLPRSGDPSREGGQGRENINSPQRGGERTPPEYRGGGSRKEEELEAVLLASALLCFYGFSMATGEIDQEMDHEAEGKSPSKNMSPSGPVPSTSTTLQAPVFTWLPLARGTPTMIQFSPLGWVIFSRGRLAPFCTGIDSFAQNHPFTQRLSSLESLVSPTYELHPRLPQPASPLTKAVFTTVMVTMKISFERFFTYQDPIGSAMTFPAKVNDEFVAGVLGRVASAAEGGRDRGRCGGMVEQSMRDPRSLVIMAHFMVLLVILEFVLPGEEEVMGLVEGEWRGDWDEDGSEDDGSEPDSNVAEKNLARDGPSLQPQQSEVRPSVTRKWWISGLGKRGILDIARYLVGLDAEEARIDGLVGEGDRRGRWESWMQWPLEMIRGDVAARVAHDYTPEIVQRKSCLWKR